VYLFFANFKRRTIVITVAVTAMMAEIINAATE